MVIDRLIFKQYLESNRVSLQEYLGNQYISVTYLENPTLESIKETIDEVKKLSKESNCIKVVMDARIVKQFPSLTDAFNFSQFLTKVVMQRGTKWAWIINKRDTASTRFVSNVVYNLRLTNKIFYNMDDAQKWLIRVRFIRKIHLH